MRFKYVLLVFNKKIMTHKKKQKNRKVCHIKRRNKIKKKNFRNCP